MPTPVDINVAHQILDRSLQKCPDRPAIIGEGLSISYKQLADRIDIAAAAFMDLGCAAGQPILIVLPDSLEFAVTLFAAFKCGAIPVPVSPYVASRDYAHYLADTGARLAIADASAVPNIPPGPQIVTVGVEESADSSFRWERLVERRHSGALSTHLGPADELAVLLYTSGSTNRQKCVMHSRNNIVMACRNIALKLFEFGHEDRILSISKPFFSFGLGFGLMFPLFAGSSTIVTGTRANLKDTVELIRIHRPTVLCAVPSFLSVLLQARSWLPIDLSSLRLIAAAGEPLPIRLFEEYKNTFGIELVDGIGSTEMLTHFISNRPGNTHPGSCGIEVPDCEAELVDDQGRPVPAGEIGRLKIKGPTSLMGYLNNPEATARVHDGEWLFTGDNLYRDGDGYYHFCGRNDDMLKVAGTWVVPHEIESVLCQHPQVHRAFVTTREDNSGRRRLVAYIVPNQRANPIAGELVRFVGSRLSQEMIPGAFIALPEMPLTSNGKVDRTQLPAPSW